MVPYRQIQASNALINDETAPRVSVFAGATSGIGKFTLKALVETEASIRVYLIGRKSSKEHMHAFIQELQSINPKAEIIWTEGEISLLAETKRICEIIKSRESRVDLLFLSAGYAPFRGREETSEGIDTVQSLEYYSRMLFIMHLLPLLEKSEAPKVVSVLAGGMEWSTINLDDLDLKKPGRFFGIKARLQYPTMKTTAMERLANENPDITFVHSWPGSVNTGNIRRSADPNSILAWIFWLVLEPIIWLIAFSDEESGQRHLFESTSAAFGGRGVPWTGPPGVNTYGQQANGLFLVSNKCESTPNQKAVTALREKAQVRVWDHTQDVLRPYL